MEGSTFTIAGHSENLPRCASAYEGDLVKEYSSEIRLGGANTKELRYSSGTEATRRLHTKGITEAGGGVAGGAIFAYFERLSLSMCFAAPS